MYPSVTAYNRTIQMKGGAAFKQEFDLSFIPSRTIPIPIFTFGSGAYAVVFKANKNQKKYAIRCFLSVAEDTILRSKIICDYLNKVTQEWKVDCLFLEDEITVDNASFPILKMEWIDGLLMNQFVSENIDNRSTLTLLQSKLVAISRSLEENHIGHGDLQCGNILIKGDAQHFDIKLIDYDGIYVPALATKTNLENGRSEFQHPKRTKYDYNERIDRFSFWVILCALEAIKYDKSLWREVMQGGFNTLDNFLFIGRDFQSFNNSNLINKLYGLKQPGLSFYLDKINAFCNADIDSVTIPELYESEKGCPIVDSTVDVLAEKKKLIEITSTPSGAVVLNSVFHRIGVTPISLIRQPFSGKTIIISYKNEIKRVQIEGYLSQVHVEFEERTEYTAKPSSVSLPEFKKQPERILLPVEEDKGYEFFWPILFSCLIVCLIAGVIFVSMQRNEAFSQNTGSISHQYQDTTLTDSGAVMTTLVDTVLRVDSMIKDTTVSSNPLIVAGAATVDSFGIGAAQNVTEFLNDINNHDYEAAFNKSFNPTWEEQGRDWFISETGFGGITKVVIQQVYETTSAENVSNVYASYYAENNTGAKMCYTQNFTVKMFDNTGRDQWMIAKVRNIVLPYDCELTQ